MKIDVHREACCAQDDQLGPLAMSLEVAEQCSLAEFLAAVAAARFLQYSATHTALHCRVAGRPVATVFSPYTLPVRTPEFVVSPATLLHDLATDHRVVFHFDPK
ncbi:MAG: hypothetical protein JWP29_652 [Rhodoferax sp.]|nr:hypothetical protein [Rhodoferax sp.]